MPSERFVFEGWQDGDFGNKPPESASFNSFTGSNVWRYRKGLLGPRPGLSEVPVTNNVAGRIWGFYAPTVLGARLVMIIEDGVYRANSDFEIDLVEFGTGSPLLNPPTQVTPFTVVELGHQIFFSVVDQNLYQMDCLNDTLTEVLYNAVSSMGPVTIKAHRDRLYVGGAQTVAGVEQVIYSEAADFTNFPAINFFAAGYGNAIYLMEPLGNNLVIGTRLSWFALVGGTPTGALREVFTSAPSGKQSTTASYEGLIWYWSYTFIGGTENGGENGEGRLAFTNGTIFDTDEYDHLRLGGLKFSLVMPKVDCVLFSSDDERIDGNPGGCALVRLNNAWAYQDFEVETTGPVANVTESTRAVFVGNDRGTSDVISITNTATGGTWDLLTNAGNVLLIPWDVTVDDLADLVYFGVTGDCTVTAGVGPIDYVLTFGGSNQGRDMLVTVDTTLATGGTVTRAITTAGAASQAKYYQLRMDLERPGFVGGFLEQPGDDSNTPIDAYFWTKLVRHPEGHEIQVRKVFVEFRKWQTGVTTNGFTARVRTFGRIGNASSTEKTRAWSEAGASTTAGADGVEDVTQLNFETIPGTGFQIGITDMVGVAVNRIVVEVDVQPRQQGAQ